MPNNMNKKKSSITDFYRNRLTDYKQPVEDDVWAKIEQDLSEEKKKKPVFFIHWRLAGISVAASLAVLLGVFFFLNQPGVPEGSQPFMADVQQNAMENDVNSLLQQKNEDSHKSIISNDKKSVIDRNDATASIKPIVKVPQRNSFVQDGNSEMDVKINKKTEKENTQQDGLYASVQENKEESISDNSEKLNDNESVLKNENHSGDQTEKPANPEKSVVKKQILDLPRNDNYTSDLSKKKKVESMSYSLLASNYGSDNSSSARSWTEKEYIRKDEGTSSGIFDPNGPTSTGGYYEFKETSYKEDIDYQYDFPVSVGFTVRKNFTKIWGLESGVTYTYLSSTEATSLNSELKSSRRLQLNYIGIPVKGTCSFVNTKIFSLYAGAGGMGEMCVHGKETDLQTKESRKLSVSEVQWSVFGNIGINVNLIDHLGLFIEPGVSYYFDDGSDIQTIRKERPVNFNLQGGLRLTY